MSVTTLQDLAADSVKRRLGDVIAVASILNCSPRHCYRLADSGRMPRPIKLGALVRWDLDVIDAWIRNGCPECKGDSK